MLLRAVGMSWIWMGRLVPILLNRPVGYVCGMEWTWESSLNSLLKIILLMFLLWYWPYAPEQAGFVLMNCELPGEGQEVRSLSEFKEDEVFVVREWPRGI